MHATASIAPSVILSPRCASSRSSSTHLLPAGLLPLKVTLGAMNTLLGVTLAWMLQYCEACTSNDMDRYSLNSRGKCCEFECTEPRDPSDEGYASFKYIIMCRSKCRSFTPLSPPLNPPPSPSLPPVPSTPPSSLAPSSPAIIHNESLASQPLNRSHPEIEQTDERNRTRSTTTKGLNTMKSRFTCK